MTKNDLIQFLTNKPGYLKKSNNIIREVLIAKGKSLKEVESLSDTLISKVKKGLRQLQVKSDKSYKDRTCTITPKRLFFDIETSYNVAKSWRAGRDITINHSDIIHERAIICVSYKWEGEETVHSLRWNKGDDKELVEKFMKVMDSADELVGHNIDNYDIKFIRTRALLHNINTLPKYVSYDTLKQARKHFALNSNKLDAIARLFGLGGKLKHDGMSMWDDIVLHAVLGQGSKKKAKKSMNKMVKYCEKDVLLTEEVYNKLRKHTERNIHHGVLNGQSKISCPNCGSENLKLLKTQVTKAGTIKRLMECKDCGEKFFLSNLNYLKLIN